MAINLFQILDSISLTKVDLSGEDGFDKAYNPWMINRYLSMCQDTAFCAELINRNWNIPKLAQYQMLLQLVKKKKRFFKYEKPESKEESIKAISAYFNVNTVVAQQYDQLLNETEKQTINHLMKELM